MNNSAPIKILPTTVPDMDKLRQDLSVEFPCLNVSSVKSLSKTHHMAIINTANRPWAVIDSVVIFRNTNKLTIQEFYFSPSGHAFNHDIKSPMDKQQCLTDTVDELILKLKVFSPGIIYLRVSPHTRSEYLVSLLRLIFPDAKLWIEFYDMSSLFDESGLNYMTAGKSEALQRALQGCAVALHYGDGLVVKMGGNAFRHWQEQLSCPVISYFPSLDEICFPQKTSDNKLKKVLYAGALSARELLSGHGSVDGANLIAYFDAIAEHNGLELDLVNAVHCLPEEDGLEKFAPLLERYNPGNYSGRVRYHRSMQRNEIIRYASQFDLGLCCAHYENDKVMEVTRVSLPNRMMTYLGAGIPVVIDDRFDYAASIINESEAGCVIPAGDFQYFLDAVLEIDSNKTRKHVFNIRHDMIQKNQRSLDYFFELIR